ncbi:sperm equatorial segment protein 1 [Notamacropus eugenii]|uniref:sperm equatorial segment protein 1 n=1 Tax=Notamacropus eugenii TaxID=9315 RepID=UPI003B6831DE
MASRQPGKISAKAAVFLAMLWLRSLSIIAYPQLLSLNDMKVDSSNLSKEDGILKHYTKILQQLFLRLPTQDAPSKEHSTTIHSEGEHEIKETISEIPGEILEETPVFLTSQSSRSNKMKPEVPLIQEPVLETESSIQHPREQDKKGQEKMVNITTKETPDNKKNTYRELDNSNLDNMNLEDDGNSVLGTEESGTEEDAAPEDATVEKAVLSVLELAVKLAMDSTQESSKKILEKLILKPFVKVTPKPVPKAPGKVHQKASLDSALKLVEEAFQQVKKKTGKRVILGQMALVAPSVMDYLGTQVHNLGRGIFQLSEETKDQPNKEQVVEDQVLKKISNINTELKHALKNAKHIEFNNDAESAKKYTMQSLSLVERENPSSNGHKPQKLTKEKDDDERIRLFINFLYDFKPQLTSFLNMNNIPFDLQEKATTIFSIMEAMLCGNQKKKKGKYH